MEKEICSNCGARIPYDAGGICPNCHGAWGAGDFGVKPVTPVIAEVVSPYRSPHSDLIAMPVSSGKNSRAPLSLRTAQFSIIAFSLVVLIIWYLQMPKVVTRQTSILAMLSGLAILFLLVGGAVLALIGLVGGFRRRAIGTILLGALGFLLNGGFLSLMIAVMVRTIPQLR